MNLRKDMDRPLAYPFEELVELRLRRVTRICERSVCQRNEVDIMLAHGILHQFLIDVVSNYTHGR